MNNLVAAFFVTLVMAGFVKLICSVFGFDWTKAMIVVVLMFIFHLPEEIRKVIQEENGKEAE